MDTDKPVASGCRACDSPPHCQIPTCNSRRDAWEPGVGRWEVRGILHSLFRQKIAIAAALAAVMGTVSPDASGQDRAPNPGDQAPGPTAEGAGAVSDPIRCWWKTDATAVGVGERFTIVLTCSVIETNGVTVVPAVNQLQPGALSIAPFEVVGGRRLDDVVVVPWRYVQFEYDVRLLSEGFFGQDVTIPALTVTYNVQAPGGGAQGRDLGYALPPLPMRILSLVPRTAPDIRDASDDTFAVSASHRFRSSAALVAAGICFAFAAVFAVLAVLYAARRFRRKEAAARALPAQSMLRGCLRALADVRAEARGGWTPTLIRRALAALRVAAAVAVGRQVSQDFVGNEAAEREGQLAVRTGLLRRRRAVLSAPVTPRVIAEELGKGRPPGARTRLALERLGTGLHVFSAARYGRNGHVDAAALDSALDEGASAVRRLHLSTLWPVRAVESIARSFSGFSGPSGPFR